MLLLVKDRHCTTKDKFNWNANNQGYNDEEKEFAVLLPLLESNFFKFFCEEKSHQANSNNHK
jgi:hypothetical protein